MINFQCCDGFEPGNPIWLVCHGFSISMLGAGHLPLREQCLVFVSVYTCRTTEFDFSDSFVFVTSHSPISDTRVKVAGQSRWHVVPREIHPTHACRISLASSRLQIYKCIPNGVAHVSRMCANLQHACVHGGHTHSDASTTEAKQTRYIF